VLSGLALGLTGCAGWNVGGVRIDPLDQRLEQPCATPQAVVNSVRGTSVAADEVRLGRLGDALESCGEEKQILVDTYNDLRSTLAPI
jgi:hypothetical protein